jgi:hypothetical protein
MTVERIRDYENEGVGHGINVNLTSGLTVVLEVQDDGVMLGWSVESGSFNPEKFITANAPAAEDEVFVVFKEENYVFRELLQRGEALITHIASLTGVSLIRVNTEDTSRLWQDIEEENSPIVTVLAKDWETATNLASIFDTDGLATEVPALIERLNQVA